LSKCPGIAGVAAAQYDFNTANHSARGISLGDTVPVHLRFDPQVTLDSCNRIYNDSFIHFLPAFKESLLKQSLDWLDWPPRFW
jgi:hypothetical protein